MPQNETITLSSGQSVTYDLSDGETFENVLIDQTASSATYAIRARNASGWTIRNVGFRGVGDRWDGNAANQHMLLSCPSGGEGLVENVYMSNIPTSADADSNTPMGGMMVRPSHNGHINFRNNYIEGMGNNASYADTPGNGGNTGTMTYDSCVHVNNTVSQYRIGTPGAEVRNCLGIVDDPNGQRAGYISGNNNKNARGVWGWHTDELYVRDSCFYVNPNDTDTGSTFHARMHDNSNWGHCELNVIDCFVNSNDPTRSQEGPGSANINFQNLTEEVTASVIQNGGVPTSPEMAADGVREYVDPFDEGIDPGEGGDYTPGGEFGVETERSGSVSSTAASMQGRLTGLGENDSADVYFEYRQSGEVGDGSDTGDAPGQ